MPPKKPDPFDWLEVKRVPLPDARHRVYLRELQDRAALLHRLGYVAAETEKRLIQNMNWDYGDGKAKSPVAASEVHALVTALYRRGDTGSGAASV